MVRLQKRKQATRTRKARRVRRRVRTGSTRPRLSVFRSLTNIYVQVIDDRDGKTLASASSQDKDLREQLSGMKKTEVAEKVGALVAERAKAAGVTEVVFDRGRYRFQGRVKALADAAREAGLSF